MADNTLPIFCHSIYLLSLMSAAMNLRPIGALAFWHLNLESVSGLAIDLGNGALRLT